MLVGGGSGSGRARGGVRWSFCAAKRKEPVRTGRCLQASEEVLTQRQFRALACGAGPISP